MNPSSPPPTESATDSEREPFADLPAIETPKGGGALTGIGEKFGTNPVNGTLSLTIPLPITPGRSGFHPTLNLSYNSGNGNGPFGLGWSLGLPEISRKTTRGIPQYADPEDSDTYILAGSEDLVPVLIRNGDNWERDPWNDGDYTVERYRPRTETTFTRIERWEHRITRIAHWRTTTAENISHIFGESDTCRIADPDDERKVFRWLLERSADAKGNLIHYSYKSEDTTGIDPSAPFEKNRLAAAALPQKYPSRISYGNQLPNDDSSWHFHVVFDYGEYDDDQPAWEDSSDWAIREDPFSTFRPGFELRTWRLCKRIMMFHDFPELGESPVLVRSTSLHHDPSPVVTQLSSIVQTGHKQREDGTWETKSYPPLELTYTESTPAENVQTADPEFLPPGMDPTRDQWVDLRGEGLTGLLSETANGWFYHANLGNGQFAGVELVAEKPFPSAQPGRTAQITDIDADGSRELVIRSPEANGFFAYRNDAWEPYRPFEGQPNLDWNDPNLKVIDLNGDGFADLLITEDDVLRWFPSATKAGHEAPLYTPKGYDEEAGPALVFSDSEQAIYLADMSGDGLTDIVRIRNGSVCYWPNLGYARFGAKITMDSCPAFDHPDRFDQSRIRLGDIDGSGTADLLYLGRERITWWLNQSGNSWSEEREIDTYPDFDNLATVTLLDLLGNGTSCLVWSSPAPKEEGHHFRYLDLMGQKPYLLSTLTNNRGGQTTATYRSSSAYYVDDLRAGTPWLTRIPFPVQVVASVTHTDLITESEHTVSHRYHHGHYDAAEREFRGFGMVESTDAETFDTWRGTDQIDLPPAMTRTWYHTGMYRDRETVAQHMAEGYFDTGYAFPDSVIANPETLSTEALREAHRALRGKPLRVETYTNDDTDKSDKPHTVVESSYTVHELQAHGENPFAVFRTDAQETLTHHFERDLEDPRITHTFLLETDNYGKPLKSVEVAYPRRSTIADRHDEQSNLIAIATVSSYIDETEAFYLLGRPLETQRFEINGLELATDGYLTADRLIEQLTDAFETGSWLHHHQEFSSDLEVRLLEWTRSYYWGEDATTAGWGEISAQALPYYQERAVLHEDAVADVYDTRVGRSDLESAGYHLDDGYWWHPGAAISYRDGDSFYLPYRKEDARGNAIEADYDDHFMAIVSSEDALGNTTTATLDYRTLMLASVTDLNNNTTEVGTDPLGMVQLTTLYGTVHGDLEGDAPIEDYEPEEVETVAAVVASPMAYIQGCSTYFYYDLQAWTERGEPLQFVQALREWRVSDLEDGDDSETQLRLGYFDGWGRNLQTKLKVNDGPLSDGETGTSERWLVSGRTVYNNKEKPVRQYEPFYSPTHTFQPEEAALEFGVSPTLYYDPLGRQIRTETAKGFLTKTEFSPWEIARYDQNDTVLESDYYDEHSADGGETGASLSAAEAHANTPERSILDVLGREFLKVQQAEAEGDERINHTEFDVAGNPVRITDPRQYIANLTRAAEDRVYNFQYRYDLLNRQLQSISADAGTTFALINAVEVPEKTWNARGYQITTSLDALNRPTQVHVLGDDLDQPVNVFEYGEGAPDDQAYNLRGQLIRQYDQAGLLETMGYDLSYSPTATERTLRSDYRSEVDWSDPTSVAMESDVHETAFNHDALGRARSVTKADGSWTDISYLPSGLLRHLSVTLKGESDPTTFVESVDYNPKGQRTEISYREGITTTYHYERETFRLVQLTTTRPEDDGSLTTLQDIAYNYDPVGNIIGITDHSQESVFTHNQEVAAASTFVYDALYQLTNATGREHHSLGKTDYQQQWESFTGSHHAGINDLNQLVEYSRDFTYDTAGNLTRIHHTGASTYARDITVSDTSNRAISDEMDHSMPVEDYFDAAGNLTQLEHLSGIEWNYRNHIANVTVIERESENDAEYYTYDAEGERVRKVKEVYNASGDLLRKEETIYLNGMEIVRQYSGTDETLVEERSTCHVYDDQRRIALVHYYTTSDDTHTSTGENLIRFHLDNHLGSSSMELDENGQLISYEEYLPYGGTAFATGDGAAEVARKTYRYSAKERDTTTGLYYHGARYYAPWLGRWLNPDPAGTVDGLNLFRFGMNNPIKHIDPDGRDAIVVIEGNTITVKVLIYVEPVENTEPIDPPTLQGIADSFEQRITQDWNNSGNGWTYEDDKHGQFDVKFEIDVRTHGEDIGQLSADKADASTNRPNWIRVAPDAWSMDHDRKKRRSHVIGNKGKWRAYDSDPSSHEFGHLLGLDDRYIEGGGAQPGWEGNIMDDITGSVEQRNIDEFLRPLMDDYDTHMQSIAAERAANDSMEGMSAIGGAWNNYWLDETFRFEVDSAAYGKRIEESNAMTPEALYQLMGMPL